MVMVTIMKKTKILISGTMPRVLSFIALVFLVSASTAVTVIAQAVSRGYSSDKALQRGLIVQLAKNDTSKIQPVTRDSADKAFGVVVDANDAAVTLSSDTKKTFVATAGRYEVLVSNQNGNIKPGDYITISAIEGVGTTATTTDPVIIGRAFAGFDGKANAVGSTEISDNTGAKRTVSLGRIPVNIGVSSNPLLKATESNLPESLRRASETIAGKPVNPIRVYISLIVFLVCSIIAASLMYSGVRSGIISIGRNPLSKKSIIRGMFQVILTGLIIFISGLFGVYLLLKI